MTVRVVGEDNLPSQGRVEVFDRGVWKAVCDSGWDIRTAASVVCRELGFGKALTTSRKASTRLLCLYGVRCMGNEDSIIECEWYNTYDRFGSVASVECSKGKIVDLSLYHHVFAFYRSGNFYNNFFLRLTLPLVFSISSPVGREINKPRASSSQSRQHLGLGLC